MQVHVSIHDVSPAWEREVDTALEACADFGARPALLVVPNFHGAWPLLDHPAYCAKLRDLQTRGHEILLHGFYHQARTDGISRYFRQRIVSGGEAELADVPPEEASFRIAEGERVLGEAGLRIDGYIAPAWSMPRHVHATLAARGYRFTEDHFFVHDPATGRSRPSVVLNYASRTPGKIASTVAYCRVAKHAARAPFLPARIAIHPADMRFLLLRREVRHLLAWAQGHLAARGTDLLA